MACFLAPAAEAIIVTIIKKNEQKKEEAALKNGASASATITSGSGIPWSSKLGWLTRMLWGGVFLLAIEHIWHGEVVPWPPFLTAMNNPADIQPMLMEILTVGGSMVLFVTAVWFVMTLVADRIYKKSSALASAAK
ncbi:MAG: hypothetical protein AWM53_01891 [Candidatus Dichloromethanomonas elyunquensis]|nr:MAG: hypothetical protein AWM53_01891 [Candidatus Dichloromethanomonas elyunquensis]